MIQLTKIEDLKGQVIVDVVFYEKCATLFFMSGDVALISIDQGWEPEDRELTLLQEIGGLNLYEKRGLKLITETEYNALVYEKTEVHKKQQEAYERQQYELLKKKFGG